MIKCVTWEKIVPWAAAWGAFARGAGAFGGLAPGYLCVPVSNDPVAVLASALAAEAAAVAEATAGFPDPAGFRFRCDGPRAWELRYGSGRSEMVISSHDDHHARLIAVGPAEATDSVEIRAIAAGGCARADADAGGGGDWRHVSDW